MSVIAGLQNRLDELYAEIDKLGAENERLQREVKATQRQRDVECERANRLAEFIRTKGLARDYDQWREPRVSDGSRNGRDP